MIGKCGFFRRYFYSELGAVAVIMALIFPIIVGMAGAGVDVSNWMMSRHRMQAAADAGALAAAWELANGGSTSDAEATALREAEKNGYDASQSGTLVVGITTDPTTNMRTVKVDVRGATDMWFSSMFLDTTVYIATTASAAEIAGGSFCVLGLDQNAVGAVTAVGSVTLTSPNCGIAINSSDAAALELRGNVSIDIGEARMVGGYDFTGSVDFQATKIRTNAAPTADPYEGLTIDPFTGCTEAQQNAGPSTYNADATLNPGVYCGGITITGNTDITMNPGTYVMDGGSFNLSGNGSITGIGVTIVLTNSGASEMPPYGIYGDLDMTGGKTMHIVAPTTGHYAGVAIYQDRNAPIGSTNRITGTAGVEIDGAVYLPSRPLQFGGNGRVSALGDPLCTRLIAKQVLFSGNPSLENNCDGSQANPIGNPTAKLVL